MNTQLIEKLKNAFESNHFEFPHSLEKILLAGLIGEEDNSPVKPWYLEHVEFKSLRERFPKATFQFEAMIFARRIDMDQLACIDKNGQVIEVHYDLGNPKFVDFTSGNRGQLPDFIMM